MAKIPAMNLDGAATPWGRWAQEEISSLRREAKLRQQGEGIGNQMQNSSIQALSKQITALGAQQLALSTAQASLAIQQARLNSLAPVTAASATGTVFIGASSWTGDGSLRPSIVIYPSTGRVRIKLTAMVGNAIGTFSMPGYVSPVTRKLLAATFSATYMQEIPTSSIGATHEWIVSGLATNVGYTITAEFYGLSGGGVAAYPSVTAENVA